MTPPDSTSRRPVVRAYPLRWAGACGHRGIPAHGHPRRHHREHRAPPGWPRPTWASPTPTGSWGITAYTLTFGGLLLLGGRIADFWGRKRTFLVGMVGFALASAVGGLAQAGGRLFAARAHQGGFGALLAPASLALLTVLFTEARERVKAFAVYGAIAGGLVLGGVVTEYAN